MDSSVSKAEVERLDKRAQFLVKTGNLCHYTNKSCLKQCYWWQSGPSRGNFKCQF